MFSLFQTGISILPDSYSDYIGYFGPGNRTIYSLGKYSCQAPPRSVTRISVSEHRSINFILIATYIDANFKQILVSILEASGHCLTLHRAGIPFCIFPFRREMKEQILCSMFVMMMSVKWGMSLSFPKRLIVQNLPFTVSLIQSTVSDTHGNTDRAVR